MSRREGPDASDRGQHLGEIEEQLRRAREENQRLRKENDRLRAEKEQLAEDIQRLEESYRQLEEDNQELDKDIEQLEERKRQLEERKRQLEKRKRQLEDENKCLQSRVEELERAALRSAAPFRRSDKDKVPPDARKRPGRKPGHEGSHRPIPAYVDDEVEAPLCGCPHCGGEVENQQAVEQYIEEIPRIQPRVVKVVTYMGECPKCGPVQSRHPMQVSEAQGAAKVHLGPRALALAALLNKSYGLTTRTTCKVLYELGGLRITAGGLAQALQRVASKVKPLYDDLCEQLRSALAVFMDETSWWVGGPGWWLWTASTATTTVYLVQPSRGSKVVAGLLGDDFDGVLVSDCLASYDPVPYRKHKCISHHLKAIAQARDRPDTKDLTYLNQWTLFFKVVIGFHAACVSCGCSPTADQIKVFEKWRDSLLDDIVCTQSGDLAIRNRLLKQRKHLLGCLHETAAEPTNNRAERDLRPAVIARKLSCGNKTEKGKEAWEILASLAATCHKRGIDFAEFLAPHLLLSAQLP